jgi:hypothetical protein
MGYLSAPSVLPDCSLSGWTDERAWMPLAPATVTSSATATTSEPPGKQDGYASTGIGQPRHSEMPRPMIHSSSSSENGKCLVNCSTVSV